MLDRALISRRLKAARWLAGTNRNGRGQVIPMSAAELAALDALQRNRVSANRIEDIEQERVDARPMELERIEAALELPAGWFQGEMSARSDDEVIRRLADLAQQLEQHDSNTQAVVTDPDRNHAEKRLQQRLTDIEQRLDESIANQRSLLQAARVLAEVLGQSIGPEAKLAEDLAAALARADQAPSQPGRETGT